MSAVPRRLALVTPAFFPLRQVIEEPGSPARGAVDMIWRWAKDSRYVIPVEPWNVDLVLPAEVSEEASLRVLAAAARHTPGGSRRILVYQVSDILGVSAVDTVHGTRGPLTKIDDGWLEQLENRSDLGRDDLVGSVRVYATSVRGPLAWAERRADSLPGSHPVARPGMSWYPTDKMLVFELQRIPGASSRRLFAVARCSNQGTLDEWLWTSPGAGLPPFTRYLLEAARLRHQSRVLRKDLPDLRGTVAEVDRKCTQVEKALGGDRVPLDRILTAERELATLGTRQQGLIEQLTSVQIMIRTVEAILHNLESIGAGGRVGAADQRIGQWTLEQLRSDQAYLAAAQLKASELTRLTAATVTTRLADRRANLALFQATVLGSVLMALAAIQSLEYKVPLPGRLQPPTITLLAAVALVLPSAVVRWPRGAGYHASWARIDTLFAAVAGAAVGWFSTSLVSWLAGAAHFAWRLHVVVTVGVAAAGAAAGWALASHRRRTLRRSEGVAP